MSQIRYTNDYDYEREERLPHYFVGLDLGQAQDPTALAVIERVGGMREPTLSVPLLKRYPLGTSYPDIVADVASNLSKAPNNARLILDGTGVGRAVVDMVREHPLLKPRNGSIHPVSIHGGQTESKSDGYWNVPKRNLVGAVQVPLQTGKLKIAQQLPDTQVLVAELQNFRVKITEAANDTYAAWREGMHDDLVLAVALACWAATHPSLNGQFRQGVFYR
jgi:hypothetical protein